jgi:hypothetical protein
MKPVDRQLRTSALDLNRAQRQYPTPLSYYPTLMKIVDVEVIAGQDKRWLYYVQEATIDTGASYAPTLSVNQGTYTALSVSELSNKTTADDYSYSYGVRKSNVAATGYQAMVIPIGSYVMAVPYWKTDGTRLYLIINTQAIDGTCTGGGLLADDDYGTLLQPSDLIFEGGELDAPEGDFDYGGITFDDFGQFYDPVNQNDQQTFASPVTFTTDYGTY